MPNLPDYGRDDAVVVGRRPQRTIRLSLVKTAGRVTLEKVYGWNLLARTSAGGSR